MTDKFDHTLTVNGRDFLYRFRPAQKPDAPLLVVLHGHNRNPRASRYHSGDWNVLCPVDHFGLNGCGSWYLGEGGDHFWLEAMPQLISAVRQPGQDLYFLGSSMGGYGALLHGMRMDATAIYANIPQVRLLGSSYAEMQGMRRYFETILGDAAEKSEFNDLRNQLKGADGPFVYLTGNRWDKPGYVKEQALPMVEAMLDRGTAFSFELFPKVGHSLGRSTAEAADVLLAHPRLDLPAIGTIPGSAPAGVSSFPEPVTNLLQNLIAEPEALWTGNKAHMAGRQRKLIRRFAKRNRLDGDDAVLNFVTDMATRRAEQRPDTFFVVNPGGAGSHWLQEILADTGDMNPCGEAYFPDDLVREAKGLDDAPRGLLFDAVHLLHAYRPIRKKLMRPLISTAHGRGWKQHQLMPGNKRLVLITRDPLDVVMSRTFRKAKHRETYFPNDDDQTYLQRNLDYVENFFRGGEGIKVDAVIRFEDLRADPVAAASKLSDDLGLKMDPSTAAEVSSHRSTNAYSGPPVVIPDDLRALAAEKLAPLRERLGYGS